jgi:hypothetical protein
MRLCKGEAWKLTCLVFAISFALPWIAACNASPSAPNEMSSPTVSTSLASEITPSLVPIADQTNTPISTQGTPLVETPPVQIVLPSPDFPSPTLNSNPVSDTPASSFHDSGLTTTPIPTRSSPPLDTTIELVPNWKAGEKRSLEIIKTRDRRVGGKVTLATTRTEALLTILEADEYGYILEWTFGETHFDDPRQANNHLTMAIANISKGLVLKLQIDSLGSIEGVTNWEEFRTKAEEAFGIIANELKGVMDQAAVDTIISQIRSIYSSEENIVLYLLPEAQLLFLPVGLTYTISEPIDYEDLLPNPLGGDPVPITAYFLLKEYDPATGDAQIEWKQSFDAGKSKEIIEENLKKQAEQMGDPGPGANEIPEITRNDSAEFTVDINSGWVKYVNCTKEISMKGATQIDTITISTRAILE